jgi:4'-phosphopantetheinyl transferase EntD
MKPSAQPAEEIASALRCLLTCRTPAEIGSAIDLIDTEEPLPPVEEAVIARAIASRRREFGAGRRCARRALAAVGGPASPIPAGPLREPIWPRGFQGSISHDGRVAAALAYRSDAPVPRYTLDIVDRPDLSRYLSIHELIRAPGDPIAGRNALRAALMFSAKEAAVKAVSPRIGEFVDFARLRLREADWGYAVSVIDRPLCVAVHQCEVAGVILSLGIADP